MRPTSTTWFFLRREPLYHKLQYSKVPKYDSSAAILGTVLGAFAGYMALATVGSGGTDLTDLTALVTWALVALGALSLSLEPRNHHAFVVCPPLALWVAPMLALRPWVAQKAALAGSFSRPSLAALWARGRATPRSQKGAGPRRS